jgi:hypothetical protein
MGDRDRVGHRRQKLDLGEWPRAASRGLDALGRKEPTHRHTLAKVHDVLATNLARKGVLCARGKETGESQGPG